MAKANNKAREITATEDEIINELESSIYFENGKFKAPMLAKDITYSEYNINEGLGILRGFLVTNDNKTIWKYNGGYYKPDGEDIVNNIIQKVLKNECTEHKKKEVIGNIKDDGNLRIDREVFDENKDFINLQNCIYNIKTGEIEDQFEGYFFNTQIPIRYDPKAKCPKIQKFLEEILPLNYIKILQEFFGDCLLGDYRYKKAIVAVGPKNTAKSTVLNLLKRFLGEENVSNVELSTLCYDRFAPWHLYRKQANICSQIESSGIKQAGKFLMLTGGDQIYAQQKGKDGFFFTNHAKLIFSCNVIPEFKIINDAVYYRWIVIPFENVFEGDDAKRNILDEICTPEEMSGLFNWAIEGLRQLEKQNDYSECMSLDEIKDFMTQGKNPIREFASTYIESDSNGEYTKEETYKNYMHFCRLHNYPIDASHIFSRKFKLYAPLSMSEGKSRLKGKKKTWKGIKCTYEMTDTQQKELKT